MIRRSFTPRADWRDKVSELGLVFHTIEDKTYWDESVAWSFGSNQVAEIESATAELYRLYLEAGQNIIDRKLYRWFGIPEWCVPLIEQAWEDEPPALNYGRFDLGYDGKSPPKLFEFNCDTPTSLLEASVIQWHWKQEVAPHADQFNSIHEKLVERWKAIAYNIDHYCTFAHVHDDAGEDMMTVSYLRDTALEAGVENTAIHMSDIGWSSDGRCFVDLDNRIINALYKLYPWEWLVQEDFSKHIAESMETTAWIEPIWKMLWSNKAILVLLWEMFPDHPNLLPAYYESVGGDEVKKPILAREGANVTLTRDGATIESSGGDYGAEGFIWQKRYELPGEGQNRPVIGSWVVDGEPAGMGIREDGLITGNAARFVPHIIE